MQQQQAEGKEKLVKVLGIAHSPTNLPGDL